MLDQSIDEGTSGRFKAYCEAYFWGCDIEVVRPGGTMALEKSRDGKAKTKQVPQDFFSAHKITSRHNYSSNGI